MRSRSPAVDHDAAVARRLQLLSQELAAARDGSSDTLDPWTPRSFRALSAVPDLGPDDDPEDGQGDDDDAGSVGLDVGRSSADPVPGSPPTARMPGRHASRRTTTASSGWRDLLPEPLRGRVWLGSGQLVVVAVLAVIGLVATCWFLVRSRPHEVVAPIAVQTPTAALVEPEGSAASAAPTGSPASADSPSIGGQPTGGATSVVVDVTGKVRRPGIAVLETGDRIVDAIRAAGGARPGVDLSALNLAQVVTDGQQIVVGGPALPPGAAAASGAPATATLVNLNTADQAALESLPEVGPVTATAIIAWRTEHGGFSAVSQLLDVDGIGDATLAQITPFVTI